METRKQFLKKIGSGAAVLTAGAFFNPMKTEKLKEKLDTYSGTAVEIARNEDFWGQVQQAFTVDRSLINLNNGGVSPSPAFVQEAMKKHLDFSNQAPVYNMWRILEPRREGVRQRLARNFGVDTEEIAITRNASESLQICQLGFDLQPGDEVLTTDQDYPRMITTFKQRERREGIKLNQISIPVPAEDDAEIVRRFEEAITPNTKLILMCHIINLTGQILPVKKVVHMARKKGIPVIVDGAHAYAHFEFDHANMDCDYYTTSLHKWLFAPHGTGMLYVRKDKIKDLWPLMAAAESQDEDIRKFEEIGTHPAANFLAIGEALTFHEGIGASRKEARLKYLNDLWIDELVDGDKVVLHTSRNPKYACGIATVEIKGMEPNELNSTLWSDYRIITTPINHEQFRGIRVTPNVYTTKEEIDRFVSAMKDQIKKV
ncbi:MAG: aminotransferase class V-fold PLP-dependent enzyme [Gracilimonas sp.]|uniref:aminotransferase class V-fold PLP-dependent enzyme n=1 Tax=Gracilimonas TaxID=649462 RepID=UPI001B08B224|nr:aminotransferase class V-fold PLP-dependent enzyme [Gracilimonas sp.]MBO6585287.1 aminotransferase class V-fold PLP-dependent enzyme [Gracilimonas sp.]MBO6616283.1 aminotransferase class V-fold PLP-dependent enzyme [Gracilimonas sp.]